MLTRLVNRDFLTALLCWGGGALVCALVASVPFLDFIMSTLNTLVHETGHAAAGWCFGCPGLPAFDFTYGGGVTPCLEQAPDSIWLYRLIFLGGFVFFLWRRCWILAGLLVPLAILHHLVFSNYDAHQIAIVYFGHGAVVVVAGIFLWRGLSARDTAGLADRSLHAFAGFLLLTHDAKLFWGIAHDPEIRSWYEEGKGDIMNDFVKLSLDHLPQLSHRRWDLDDLAVAQFTLCCLTPFLVLAFETLRRAWILFQEEG
ncbi:MAG: hypothetical protein RL095_1004 [Verrucomicrobiota bacterium]|jgi:hypothetical protein